MSYKRCRLIRAFGVNEYGFPDLPKKISGVKISRLLKGEEMGCSYCFPHGFETINSRYSKNQRNWKVQRKTQYCTLKVF